MWMKLYNPLNPLGVVPTFSCLIPSPSHLQSLGVGTVMVILGCTTISESFLTIDLISPTRDCVRMVGWCYPHYCHWCEHCSNLLVCRLCISWCVPIDLVYWLWIGRCVLTFCVSVDAFTDTCALNASSFYVFAHADLLGVKHVGDHIFGQS